MKLFMMTLIFTFLSITPAFAIDEKARHFTTFDIKTEISNTNYQATVYRPLSTSIKAMLIISPTIEGVTTLEKSLAKFFTLKGFVVIVPEQFATEMNAPAPDAERLNADFYKSATSSISFINLIDQKLNLSPDLPVFALGASMGGIFTVILTSNIPRIKAAWFNVAGSDLPNIYAYSDVEELVTFRTRHMKTLGMTSKKEYEAYLRMYLKNDPGISCQVITVPIYQVIALKDTSVPTKNQELLASECPPHGVSRYNINHTSGAIRMVNDRERILTFFNIFI